MCKAWVGSDFRFHTQGNSPASRCLARIQGNLHPNNAFFACLLLLSEHKVDIFAHLAKEPATLLLPIRECKDCTTVGLLCSLEV